MQPQAKNMLSSKSIPSWIWFAFVCLLALIVMRVVSPNSNSYNEKDVYAVFLSNSEVYFGNITDTSADQLTLENIYYFRSNPATQDEAPEGPALIKLGNEIHGPEDTMLLSREHILYMLPLRDDSPVVEAIQNPAL